MPTSYTAGIEDGTITTLQEFALICARAMGACIMQREEPLSVPARYRKVSNYHAIELLKAKAILKKFQETNVNEAAAIADFEYLAAMEEYQRCLLEHYAARDRYGAMRTKVVAWNPPSKDHEGLKSFMLEQIDTCLSYLYGPDIPTWLSAKEWLAVKIRDAEWRVNYHQNEAKREVDQVISSNKWLDQLTESLSK